MHDRRRTIALLLASGTALSIAAAANAQPFVVNITGATLQQNFFQSLGVTQDFINVDAERGDLRSVAFGGWTLATELQLASGGRPTFATTTGTGWPVDSGTSNIAWWEVTYRAVGSGNGLLELSRYGLTPQTNPAEPFIFAAAPANLNRTAYINAGVAVAGIANSGNPGASPVRGVAVVDTYGKTRYQATFDLPNTASPGGYLADIAPCDVIPEWFIGVAGTGNFDRRPGEAGYGNQTVSAVKTDGTPALFTYPGEAVPRAFASSFGPLPNGVDTVATHGGPVLPTDTHTIFATPSAYNSVAAVTNIGTGKRQMTYTDLRHLSVTGRLSNGENLMFINRDADSGTRNAFTTPLRLDASWALGENIGALSVLNDTADLGFTALGSFQPSQKGSSGALERTVFNHRLAIGHSGSERGVGSSWLTNGTAEVLAVKDDIGERDENGALITDAVTGTPLIGTEFVRPTVGAVCNNGYIGQLDPSSGAPYTHDGYRIASLATLNTIGDPRMAPAAKGGYGYAVTDPTGVNNPPMRNVEAASFINNITRSIDAYLLGSNADFSPVDQLVRNFLLPQAVDRVPSSTKPTEFGVNPVLIQSIQNDAPTRSQLANAAYIAFGNGGASSGHLNGAVPRRGVRPSGAYSDGLTGNTYQTKGGTNLTGGGFMTTDRNRIAGDFDGNGKRDINDIPEMVRAFRWRAGSFAGWSPLNGSGPIAGAPGADICVEIIGDFDGNGSFDLADLWYFADGLATTAVADPNTQNGALNRFVGFAAIDNASLAQTGTLNFFGTTLATGTAYTAGASAADVAGPTGRFTPGYAPIGHDGAVNAYDLDYIYRQFKRNPRVTDGALNWSNLSESIRNLNASGEMCGDLSCDVNGDLVIDQNDINFVLVNILHTTMGDVNLDGASDATDRAIIVAHLGQNGGWVAGDLNGDGVVNGADLAIFDTRLSCSAADVATAGNPDPLSGPDGFITGEDFDVFIIAFYKDLRRPSDNGLIADLTDGFGTGGPDGFTTGTDFDFFVIKYFQGC